MKLALLALAAGALIYGLHRLALWLEGRGWIYYRQGRGHATGIGNAMLEVHALLEPTRRHAIEASQERQDESLGDDPPEPGA